MERGWSEQKQSFVQSYGSEAIDASALLISLTRFTAAADPRIVRTIDRIQQELMHEPHVYRYRVGAAADDGLAGHGGTFSICSFWLVEALTRAGRLEEARQNLEQMLTMPTTLACTLSRNFRPGCLRTLIIGSDERKATKVVLIPE